MKRLSTLVLAASLLAGTALAQAPDGSTLVIAQSTDANTFDPANISSRTTSNIAEHIFGTLYDVTGDGEIVPFLAESHEVSEDGKSVTFKLKEGLTCHDGEPLTAEDAAYSFNRAADPDLKFTGNTPGFIYSSIGFEEAVADDDLHVTLKLKNKSPILLGMIGEVFIHCKGSYEAMSPEEAAQTPIGSGPYKFVEWVRDDRVVLEKWDDYTLEPGSFDRLVWRVIPEASTRAAELMAGNVDVITNVAPDQIETINRSDKAEVVPVQGTRRIYIGFNQKDKFAETEGGKAIQNADVRRALQYAVDVPTICEGLLGTPCTRATGLVNPPRGNPDLEPYPYDPDKAEELLDAAGYPRGDDGVRFTLTLQSPNGRYLNDANVALAVGQFLSDIGVKTDVELLEFASVYIPLIRAHDAGPLFLLGSGGATWSALYDMADLSAVDAGTNYTEWKDEEFFAGWKKIEAAQTPEEEREVINEMLKIFYERGPWLLMYFQPDFYGISERLDWEPRRDEHINVTDAKLK